MFDRPILLLLAAVCLLASAGCRKAESPAGYQVVGYERPTQQWTLLYKGGAWGGHEVRRLVVVCTFYSWGGREPVKGPDACHLVVGRTYVTNMALPPAKPSDYVLVSELPNETLDITEGQGADQVRQQFTIVRHELVTPAER